MKFFFFLLVLFSLNAAAQVDSADRTITVQLPVKGVVLYGTYIAEVPSWKMRKIPDVLHPLIGTGTKPDSLVTVTVPANSLYSFINRILNERYGAIYPVAQSIFHNAPAITGYTGLFQQITVKANGNGSEKAAATWIRNRYLSYDSALQAFYNELYQKGVNWIKD